MKKKIIIIGGGIAGLSAGIYSAMNGFDTEILEMHNVAGGQWLFPGGGLPPAAQTGKFSVQLICKKEKQTFINNK